MLARIARTALALAAAALFLLPLERASPAEATDSASRVHEVTIKGMEFVPATLEVSVGDTIEWVNEDLVPHTATAIRDGRTLFDSGVFPAKASWRYVASEAGSFPYVCLLHPTMKGKLIVR